MGCVGGVLHVGGGGGLWMGCVGGVLHVMGYCEWGVLVVFYMLGGVWMGCVGGVLHVGGWGGAVDGVCWWCFTCDGLL